MKDRERVCERETERGGGIAKSRVRNAGVREEEILNEYAIN